MDRMTEIEERLAHLARNVEDLSEMVVAHQRDIDTLGRRLALLMESEAERQAAHQASFADKPPPHW